MTEYRIDSEISIFHEKITELTLMIKDSLDNAYISLETNNKDLALRVVREDNVINSIDAEINDIVIAFLVREQPVASDLRAALATMNISQELERIGDYATNMASVVLKLEEPVINQEFLNTLGAMVEQAKDMLDGALLAFHEKDLSKAKEVAKMDEQMDELYKRVIRQTFKEVNVDEDQERIIRSILLAKSLERSGDHVKNIAENIGYYVRGKRYDFS